MSNNDEASGKSATAGAVSSKSTSALERACGNDVIDDEAITSVTAADDEEHEDEDEDEFRSCRTEATLRPNVDNMSLLSLCHSSGCNEGSSAHCSKRRNATGGEEECRVDGSGPLQILSIVKLKDKSSNAQDRQVAEMS